MEQIYILIDPETLETRYVGYTSLSLEERLSAHLKQLNRKKTYKTFKNRWVRKLVKKGLTPIIKRVHVIKNKTWQYWETKYIRIYRKIGAPLTNGTIGGDGGKGRVMSEEQKKKIGDFHRGKVISEEQRTKLSKARFGKKHLKVTRGKISLSNKGKHGNIPIKVTDLLNGETYIFSCAQEASYCLGIGRRSISHKVNRNGKTEKYKFEKY